MRAFAWLPRTALPTLLAFLWGKDEVTHTPS
eukprot:CAMPEP_0194768814 /NCGR_PEP_ID=MMETSP0323_2-20130528/40915_1 /TAXON_ID=2866 ORGANISM="Crypthecodinium cohnii, Strain Seligo" /NCGR_SAMPLE_ID=MMETSP0323_2 /ASSEMBLY_ACC=CAM_ASM_000346 /LENGTH=30 /DNA_ID= /DNA_START= /DNA_END= /DNA_ORIENTATION=